MSFEFSKHFELMKYSLCLSVAVLFLASTPVRVEEKWSTDAEASVKQSRAESKDMLILYTGSDWCPPCIAMEEKILGTEEFQTKASGEFVMVKFDYPRALEQTADLKEQNAKWADQLGVDSFPTLVLLDHEQRPYAFTGSRDESPDEFFKHLLELKKIRIKRDEAFKKAESEKGADRAKLLDEGLSAMTTEIAEVYYEKTIEEIVELDKEDEAGLRTKYFAAKDKERRKALMTDIAIATRLRAPQQAIEFIDEKMKEMELPPEMKLQALSFKLQLLGRMKNFDGAIVLLDEMIGIPELTPTGIQRLIVKKVYILVGAGKRDDALSMLSQEIRQRAENLHLVVAKGELLDGMGDYEGAIAEYDKSLTAASSQSELLIELTGAKADALVELNKVQEALAVLDAFVENRAMPADLKAEALLQKAIIYREKGQTTAALRAESSAIEAVETQSEKAQIQKLIDSIRAKITMTAEN